MSRKRKPKQTASVPARIPKRFEPRFWADADQRQIIIKEIKGRIEQLRKDAGVESIQQEMLIQRAIFISLRLETMEVNCAEGKDFNEGSYTQMVNALSGLLAKLGLEKKSALKGVQAKIAQIIDEDEAA